MSCSSTRSHDAGTSHRSGNRHRNRRNRRKPSLATRNQPQPGRPRQRRSFFQNTLHGSILQNSVKQGKLLPSMTATLVTRKRCTDIERNRRVLPQSTAARQKTSLAARAAKLGNGDFSLNSIPCSGRATARGLSRATAAALAAHRRDDGTSHRTNGNDGRNHRSFRNRRTALSCWHNHTTAQKRPGRRNHTTAQQGLPRRHIRTTALRPSHNRKTAPKNSCCSCSRRSTGA